MEREGNDNRISPIIRIYKREITISSTKISNYILLFSDSGFVKSEIDPEGKIIEPVPSMARPSRPPVNYWKKNIT